MASHDIGTEGAVNSANCHGQLTKFIVSTVLVQTHLGYKRIMVKDSVMSTLGFLSPHIFFKIKMSTMYGK